MTESKPIYNTLNDYELAEIRCKKREANQTMTINGQPLTNKQLHELIISQSMTIDAALTKNGELVDALKRVQKLLQEGKFYEAWHEINKVLD